MKKFKVKRNKNKKIIFIIFIVVFFILFIWISFYKLDRNYNNYITFLLDNTNFGNNDKKFLSILTNNLDILLNKYEFIKKDELVINNIDKKIYIYNTHNNELYSDNTSVLDVSNMFYNNLKKIGIDAIMEEKMVSDYLHTGIDSYDISRNFIEDIKEKENINYYIDIHRDSVNNTTIEINNKKYAKILFVLGLENPNYEENKIIISKMNNYLNENYPGISKGIYEKKGNNVNGVYNQDIDKNVLLIEVGGIENNYEEVRNSTEIIALMLYHMLGDNK